MAGKKIKDPLIAALLNFFLIGLGYLYVGKRVWFGIGLIVWNILFTGIVLLNPGLDSPLIWLDSIALSFLFAWDGWKTAEEVNKSKKR